MLSTQMATSVCTRSWTPGRQETCSWIAASESEISAVLAQLGKVSVKPQLFRRLGAKLMADQMDRREALVAEAAERGVAVPDLGRYDTWRNVTDFAVGRCEGLMDDQGRLRHSPRLHCDTLK